jgi:hypothetical protein
MKRKTKLVPAVGILALGIAGNVVLADSALAKGRAHHGHALAAATTPATDPDNVQFEGQSGDQTTVDATPTGATPLATASATDPDNVQFEDQSGDQTTVDGTTTDATTVAQVRATHRAHGHKARLAR